MGIEKWEKAENYIGENYEEYYVIIAKNRDSEPLDRANFDTAIKLFNENKINYICPTLSHWLCGWIEVILIHEDNLKDLEYATNNIYNKLQEYPVLDDELFCEYEYEEDTYYCCNCKTDTHHEEGICDVCGEE